jgi:thioesterase domain-containing protein
LNPNELEQYLHARIPLSRAMQVSVVNVQSDSVILSAPLAPNINHHDTVFGGSASAVAILAAWSLVHTRLKTSGISSDLVIQRNTMHYELPIAGAFTARSFIQTTGAWESFTRILVRKGRARITVSCILEFVGQPVGHFDGEFVALCAEDAKFFN